MAFMETKNHLGEYKDQGLFSTRLASEDAELFVKAVCIYNPDFRVLGKRLHGQAHVIDYEDFYGQQFAVAFSDVPLTLGVKF